ncbi:MAG: hypothetical protein LUC93_06210 [Planctomycetaceae bacterium]|nr:hypothetical protein [Planctomycetaceae bacterium]
MEDTKAKPEPAVSAEALDEADSRHEEAEDILQNGPRSANRSGALAFLALAVIVVAALHFYLSAGGGAAYVARLDGELLNHASLSLAAMEADSPMAIAPSWPLNLYEHLRRDILVYCALVACAAYIWSLAARARARRDAFVIHDKLAAEVAELRARLDQAGIAQSEPPAPGPEDTKGL